MEQNQSTTRAEKRRNSAARKKASPQETPQSAAAPAGIFRGLLPADLIMRNGEYSALSSYAVVLAGWLWVEARKQRQTWASWSGQPDNSRFVLATASDFRYLNLSINHAAKLLGCGWRQARAAMDELKATGYLLEKCRRRGVAGDKKREAQFQAMPDYALKHASGAFIEAGNFERVTIPLDGPITRRHLSIVLQRFETVHMKNGKLMEVLGLKRRRILQRYLQELMESGEIERNTHAGYGNGRVRKIKSNVRPVRDRDRGAERPSFSVQNAHASVQSSHASVQSAPPYKTPKNIQGRIDTPLKRGALPGSPASSGFRDAETAKPRPPGFQENGLAGTFAKRAARSNAHANPDRQQRAIPSLTPMDRRAMEVGKRVLRGSRKRHSADRVEGINDQTCRNTTNDRNMQREEPQTKRGDERAPAAQVRQEATSPPAERSEESMQVEDRSITSAARDQVRVTSGLARWRSQPPPEGVCVSPQQARRFVEDCRAGRLEGWHPAVAAAKWGDYTALGPTTMRVHGILTEIYVKLERHPDFEANRFFTRWKDLGKAEVRNATGGP